MPNTMDPYVEWLGIKAPQRPLNYYQLLGLKLFEDNSEQIARGAMLQISVALRHEAGPQRELARTICAELQSAEECLTSSKQKAEYDSLLRQQMMADQFLGGGRAALAQTAQLDCSFDTSQASDSKVSARDASESDHSAGSQFADVDLSRQGEEDDSDSIHDQPLRSTQVSNRSASDTVTASGKSRLRVNQPVDLDDVLTSEPTRDGDSQVLHSSEVDEDDDDDDSAAKSQLSKLRAKRAAASSKSVLKSAINKEKPKKAAKAARSDEDGSDIRTAVLVAVGGAAVIAAIWLVPRINWGPSAEVTAMIAQLESPDPSDRISALAGLSAQEIPSGQFPRMVTKILQEDKDLQVRRAAAEALTRCNQDLNAILPEVKQILEKETDNSIKVTLTWIAEHFK